MSNPIEDALRIVRPTTASGEKVTVWQKDERIASLGLQNIGLTQFCDVLPPLGVTVINGAKITVPPPHRVLSTPTPTGGKE